ncbi:MAG: biotin/lipoyl-binding protein [Actinomycetia bacterium]|nr:biotin/lipoyl-binding protein [Actinomycetes bacterium]
MSKGRVIAAIVALLIIGGIVAAVTIGGNGSAVEVSVEPVERGPIAVTVSASGEVKADEKGDVFPPTAGTLASIEVTEGQEVRAGDIIAVMDTAPIEAQVAQAEAAYEAALAQADSISQSSPTTADKKAAAAAVSAARSAYDAASRQYELAKKATVDPTALAQAQAAVAVAETAYNTAAAAYEEFKTTVYDPAPEPRDPALETALAALAMARDQAASTLAAARQNLALVQSSGPNPAAVAAAKTAKDQAWAAYQGALAQQAKLDSTDLGAASTSADAAVEAAKTALDLALATLEKATLRAPMDGVVVFNDAGASLGAAGLGAAASTKATVGSSVSPAAAPFSVVYFDQLVFSAEVDEADIARLAPGMKAVVSLDALPDETYETSVERVEKTSIVTSTGGTAFSVLMRLSGVGDKALIGMNGSADIEVESIGEAISVPVEAVLDDNGTSYVYVISDDKARRVKVTTGEMTDTRAVILSGVKEGDKVAVTGLGDLTDGATVKVK